MTDPFSEFSKGTVLCKYRLIEQIGNHKARGNVSFAVLVVWMIGWLLFLRLWPESWGPIVIAFLPFLFGSWLFKRVFPYRVVGLVEFANERLTIQTAPGTPRSLELRTLRSMRVGESVAKDFVHIASSVRNQRAYRLQIKGKDEVIDLHCLNAIHLTKEDEQKFMSPPPTFITTLGVVRDVFKIRFYDLKGRESSLV
jgi:hypothetical protein